MLLVVEVGELVARVRRVGEERKKDGGAHSQEEGE